MFSKTVSVQTLIPLNFRPVIDYRVRYLRDSIASKGYDPSCPLVVQRNCRGYLVVNGCHRLRALQELNISEVPVVEYPAEEDPVKLALMTQENDESVQPWDFLDRAFLVKRLYGELGTLDTVAERMGWKDKSNAHHYLRIANLPEEALTVIRNSVNKCFEKAVNDAVDHGQRKNLDDIWSVRWFRHICSLPADELKLSIIKKIAENPEKWKEKDVASECSKLKKRYELSCKMREILECQENCKGELNELLSAIEKGMYDLQPEKAVERAEAILKVRQKTDLELMQDWGYEPQVFTIWKFNGRDERFGIEHPGNIPAGIVFNVLYYFTKQDDLVIDPMAGGGVTIDVCQAMKRRCLAFDAAPVRDDITKHDATVPWSVEKEPASLVFLDPPYWKQKKGAYQGENDLAKLDLVDFYEAMNKVFRHAKASLKHDGFLAVIVGPTQDSGRVYDHALEFASLLKQLGFEYVNRIIVPYTTQQVSNFDVGQARKSKFLLKLHRDLLIYRKGGG